MSSTVVGTDQFFAHTRLMTKTVADVMSSVNPLVDAETAVQDAIVKMTEYGFGCVTVVNSDGSLVGVFTDGDLRRLLEKNGRDVLSTSMADLVYNDPIRVEAGALLNVAEDLFHTHKVDNLLVVRSGEPVGMLDIQDL